MTYLSDLHIRPACDADMDAVCDIALRAWVRVFDSFLNLLGEEVYAGLHSNWQEGKEGQIRRHYASHPDWAFVAESQGQVVGFLTYAIQQHRYLGIIGNNAVDPDFQGRGIATRMYEHVLERFRQSGLRYAQVHTGLDEGHAPARRAYEKAGFGKPCPEVTYHMEL